MKFKRLFLVLFLITYSSIATFASVEVLGSLKHVHNAKPGDVLKGEIRIQNTEDIPQEVRIYQTDLLYNYQENTFYDEPGAHGRSNASWIGFSPKSLVMNPKESRLIQYEITVPFSDTLNGTFWSVLMVEGVTPIDPNQSGTLNIRTVTRYAIQITTEIVNRGLGLLKFLEPTLVSEGNKLYLAVDVKNDGSRYIAPDVTIEVFDASGSAVKVLSASKKGLYPSTSVRFKFDLEGLPARQNYQLMIVAAGQEEDVFGLEYTLYF